MPDEERYTQIGGPVDGETAVAATEDPKPVVEGQVETPTGEETPMGEIKTEGEESPKKIPGSRRAHEKVLRLEIENQMLKEQLAGKKPAEPAQPEAETKPARPSLATFNGTHEEYEAALDTYLENLSDWKVKQTVTQLEAAKKQQEINNGWAAKAEAAREKYEDFDEALAEADASPVVIQKMRKSPVGADIGYYLATNPKERKAINTMDPEDAYDALKAVEKRFTEPKPKRETNAPPPVVPLGGTSTVVPPKHRRDTYVEIK